MRAALLLLGLLAVAFATEDPTEALTGVQDLTPDTFDKVVNGKKHAIVEFYAPWCGHCKRLTPVYKELGEKVTSDGKLNSRVVIAKVNADEHRSLGERFGVQGFPTIKYFGRGKAVETPEDYNSGRTLDAFLEFIDGKLKSDAGFARVEKLDPLAKKFVGAESEEAKKEVLAETIAVMGDFTGDDAINGDIYVKVMGKVLEKGEGYVAKELARVDKMLEGGAMSAHKVDQLSRKASVLKAFTLGADEE